MWRPSKNGIADEALITALRAGDREAEERLYERYKDTVRIMSRQYYLAGADRDDLLQEGMIGLYKAVRDYREDRNAGFSSFAEMCISRQLISAVKMASRKKHTPLNTYVSLYVREENGEREGGNLLDVLELMEENPEDTVIQNESADAMRVKMEQALSPLEKQVVEMFLEGMTYEQIAEAAGCTKKSVDNALYRVKKKLGRDIK